MRSSKKFLIDRIVEQAKLDAVPLTEIEIRMLGFSEATAAARDLEAAQAFDRDYDDEAYEEKIADLIRQAYQRDKAAGSVEAWDAALVHVAGRDMYLNVMLDRSGIAGQPLGPFADWRFILYAVAPSALFITVAIAIGFSPFGARLFRSDAIRFSIAILALAAPFLLRRIASRSRSSRCPRRQGQT